MTRDIRNIAIAVASVLVVLIITVLLFIYGESDIALIFALVGVPIILVIASAWYIKSVKQRRLEDPAARVKERELRSVCGTLVHLRNRMHAIEDAHSITIPESVSEIAVVESRLAEIGGGIDPDNQSITCDQELIKGVTLFAIRNTAESLEQTETQLVERLYDAAIKHGEDVHAKLGTLSDAGYDIESHRSELASLAEPAKNLDEITYYLDRLKIVTEDVLRGCVDDAKKLAEYHTGDTSAAQVEDALDKQDYSGAVSTLEQDIATLKTATEEEFQAYRSSLLSALDTAIDAVNVTDATGAIDDKKFMEFKETVVALLSPEKLVQLNEIGDAFVKHCQGIVDRMHAELSDTETQIKEFMVPEYFWRESGLEEKEYALDKETTESAAASFVSMIGELMPALYMDRKAYKILNSYHQTVERQIKKGLVSNGSVPEANLKVAHPEDFLRLYDYYHPDASYSDGTLHLAEGAKTIENPLTITVTGADLDADAEVDAGENAIQDAKITIVRGSGIGVTLHQITGEDGSVTIENPGEGKYQLIVDADQYRRHEDTIVLPAERIDIKLERLGIKDYLCREKEKSIRENLKRYSSDVLKELDRAGVVSSEFEMYINKEYRACVLYILAEEYPNLRFISSGSEYLVYDEQKMVSRLIDSAKAINKDTYTISDLDIPLPDGEVYHLIEIAGDAGTHIAVEQHDAA
ncbi:MAG: carboxypeptidase-like regulatory domain-containing protein [Euryarchaeota archaeon]|nr:MAG: hypothetical protein C5S47_05195 [ANME-2 cluster archaeon]MEA1865683.1 carboxypeptidase-like regulatory domain-containing protein [Euryarchaeota archaeon]